jgi:hypothetical protein
LLDQKLFNNTRDVQKYSLLGLKLSKKLKKSHAEELNEKNLGLT